MSDSVAMEAASFYDGLLTDGLAGPMHEQFADAMRARKLLFGDRLRCNVLRPRFIGERTYQEVQRGAVVVTRALTSLHDRLARSAELRQELGVPPLIEAFANLDGGTAVDPIVGRLDGLLDTTGSIQFIEYNPIPGASIEVDELADIFRELPPMRRLAERYDCYAPPTRPPLMEALRRSTAQMGVGARPPGVAIVGVIAAKNQPSIDTLQQFLQQQGAPVRVASPVDDWELLPEGLHVGGTRVDVLVFPYIATALELVTRHSARHPVVEAVRSGRAFILNGMFRSMLLGSKQLFALLSDPECAHLGDPELIAEARSYVPWTRRVREGKTIHEGRKVDLLEHVREHRERFVLKPEHGTGGEGVVLGRECSAEDWEAALERARAVPHVVQERVETPRESYPVPSVEGLRFEEHHSDLNPYVWSDSSVSGCMVRLAKGALLNMNAAGSMTPLFVIRGRR
ncbi:hypothetical protein JQX13_00115 [Archangium violaceum]|uniref:hypothetical protein n=1 Tax=Archangium violaceum TaxID=83451 RepID=UPI00193B639F|nr:hypothetical protein [Archangium violaceum]QRK08636.1 hypothetical protein JQX13_00115 [Archangium violaceum]